MFTSTFWKRETLRYVGLGAVVGAALLSGVPNAAMADGRFRPPYGGGPGVPGPVGEGRPPHNYTPPPGSSGRFGPPLGAPPIGGPDSGRPSADLQLSNTSPNPATQGQKFDYTLTVTNAGPAPTSDVNLSDQLPEGVRLVQAVASQGVCSTGYQFVRCALDTLAGGHAATVTITVNAVRAGTVYNTATVRGREYDAYEGNNTATAVTDIRSGGQYGADLSVTNSVDRSDAMPGENLTYTITVLNAGPAVSVGTHLSDQLPQGAEFVSATPGQGSCAPSDTDVVCELGDLASGATATVTVVVRVTQSGSAVNVAYVTSRMLDENTGDNQAQATTQVGSPSGGSGPGGGGPGPISPLPARPQPVNDGDIL